MPPRIGRFLIELLICLLIFTLVITVVVPVHTWFSTVRTIIPDPFSHRDWAAGMAATGQPPTPHFLYHLFTIGLWHLTGRGDWTFAAFLSNVLPHGVTALIAYVFLRLAVRGSTWAAAHRPALRLLSAAGALAIALWAPLFVVSQALDIEVTPILIGFIPPVVYHNPTTIMLRPIALILFAVVSAAGLGVPGSRRAVDWLLAGAAAAVLTIAAGSAKPNYLLALLPAFALWTFVRLVQRAWHDGRLDLLRALRWPGWAFALFGVGLPGVLLLIWQYNFTYLDPNLILEGTSGIQFAPLASLRAWVGSRSTLLLHFALSAGPPALIYLLHWRRARRDVTLNFAWLGLGVALIWMYLLAEVGDRVQHGNFWWTAYVAMLMVIAASVRMVLLAWVGRVEAEGGVVLPWPTLASAAIIVVHTLSGVLLGSFSIQWIAANVLP